MSIPEKPERLYKFGFDIVHGCQLRCVGCPNSTLNPEIKFITMDDFKACLKNIDVPDVVLFRLFNFGDPLLHPNLVDLLLKIPEQKWKARAVEISTNAQKLDEEMLAEAFKTGVIKNLAVSCDGDGTPRDYEKYRKGAKWEKLIEFLTKASELRNKYSPNTTLLTRTICTNGKDQNRWTSILKPLGWTAHFRSWILLPDAVKNPSGRNLVVPKNLCLFMKKDAETNLYVDYDGTVVPCCIHPKAFVLGNLKENTFTELWTGCKRIEMRKEMKSNRKNMSVCGRCEK